MLLVRYLPAGGATPAVGVLDDTEVRRLPVATVAELLRLASDDVRGLLDAGGPAVDASGVRLLAPIDGRTEVWASGVTYDRSREARREESSSADVYDLVYDAERPELFYKAAAWRVVTDGEPIAIRRDSELNVPEPELAAVVNAGGEIVGWTVCDDVSSRSIEGANPLYLPQAKVYAGSCALAAGIRPAWEVDATDLAVSLVVRRDGEMAWSGRISTSALHRRPADLVDWLYAEEQHPDGAVLSTGTGIVPGLDFGLAVGDEVEVAVDGVGRLTNHVVAGRDHFAWLAEVPVPRPS